MPIIAVLNPKGGVGKTTLSLNLGLFLEKQGRKISFIDLDAQRSLSHWLKYRPKQLNQFYCFKADINNLEEQSFFPPEADHFYILDSPAAVNKEQIFKLFSVSDMVLIPVLLNPVDLHALSFFLFHLCSYDVDIMRDKPVGLIANKTRLYTNSHTNTMKKIGNFTLPIIGMIRDTQNYTIPAAKGMGLIDLPPWRVKKDTGDWEKIISWINGNLKQS